MSKQLTEFDAAELTTPLSAHLKVFEHDARRFCAAPQAECGLQPFGYAKNERKLSLEHLRMYGSNSKRTPAAMEALAA